MGNNKFASKVHLGVISSIRVAAGDCNIHNIGGPVRLMYVVNIKLQVDMGVKKGIYNGVQST